MKVLLDENLDHRLRTDDGFDVLVTGDQSLCYEQNLAGRQLAIVAVPPSNGASSGTADNAVPGSFQAVECGTFSRKKNPTLLMWLIGIPCEAAQTLVWVLWRELQLAAPASAGESVDAQWGRFPTVSRPPLF